MSDEELIESFGPSICHERIKQLKPLHGHGLSDIIQESQHGVAWIRQLVWTDFPKTPDGVTGLLDWSDSHDVVYVTRFSSQAPETAAWSGCGPDHVHLLLELLIDCIEVGGRLHWRLQWLKPHIHTQTLRSAAPGFHLRLQTSLPVQVDALHGNGWTCTLTSS